MPIRVTVITEYLLNYTEGRFADFIAKEAKGFGDYTMIGRKSDSLPCFLTSSLRFGVMHFVYFR